MFAEMGHLAKLHSGELLFRFLSTGFTELCSDAAHPTADAAGVVTVASNIQAGTDPAWYLLDMFRSIKPLIWQERDKYEFQSVTSPKDGNVFMTDEHVYGVRARVNAGHRQAGRHASCECVAMKHPLFETTVELASEGGAVPTSVHLFPLGRTTANDGRVFIVNDAEAIIAWTLKMSPTDLPIGFEHQNDDKEARKNGPIPAAGWMQSFEVKEDGIWA